jgi:hypothetical protein
LLLILVNILCTLIVICSPHMHEEGESAATTEIATHHWRQMVV